MYFQVLLRVAGGQTNALVLHFEGHVNVAIQDWDKNNFMENIGKICMFIES